MFKIISFSPLASFNLYSWIQASRLPYRKTINHFFKENTTYIPTIGELDSIKSLSKLNALEIIANHCLKHIKDPCLFIDYINYLESNSICYNRPQLTQEKIASIIESPSMTLNQKQQFWEYLSQNTRTHPLSFHHFIRTAGSIEELQHFTAACMDLRPGTKDLDYELSQIQLAQKIAIQNMIQSSSDNIYTFISSADQLSTVALVEVLTHCKEPLSLTSCLDVIVNRDDYALHIERTQEAITRFLRAESSRLVDFKTMGNLLTRCETYGLTTKSMWILSLQTVTTYSELIQVNEKVKHTKDIGDDWKDLYDSKLVTLIDSGRLCFEDIFQTITDCHEQKLDVRLVPAHINVAIKFAQSALDIERLLSFKPSYQTSQNLQFVSKSIGECLNRIGEPRENLSDEECIERGAEAIRILEYLKHGRFPGIVLDTQHICQAIKFAATPLQLFRMLHFIDSSNELDRHLSYSICNAINHFRQVEDSQLIDLFRDLVLQINTKNDFIIQCVKHCQHPDTLNEMLHYFEGKDPEKRDILNKAIVTCLFKQRSDNAYDLVTQFIPIASSHRIGIESSKVFLAQVHHCRTFEQWETLASMAKENPHLLDQHFYYGVLTMFKRIQALPHSGRLALIVSEFCLSLDHILNGICPEDWKNRLVTRAISCLKLMEEANTLIQYLSNTFALDLREIKNECSRWIDYSLAPLVGGARLGWINFYSACHVKSPRFFKLDNDLVSVMSKYITGPDYQAKLLEMFQIANMEDRHLKSLSIGYQNCSIENIQTMYRIFKPSTIPSEERVITAIKKALVLTAIKKVRSVEQFQWVKSEIEALDLVFEKGSILASSLGDAISHHWPIELLAIDTLEIPNWCLEFSRYNKDIFRMIMARLDKYGLQRLAHTLYLDNIENVFRSKRLQKRHGLFELDCHGMNMAIAKRFVITHLNYFEEQKASFLIVTGKGLHQRQNAIFEFRDQMYHWLLHDPRLHKWFEDRLYTIDVRRYDDGWVTCTKRHKRKL